MNRNQILAAMMTAFLASTPLAASAHGAAPAAAHGGMVVEDSGDHWVELVIKGDQLTVYVSDADNKPLAPKQLGGKATIVAGSKKEDVALSVGDGNSLRGTLAAPATGKTTTLISLSVGGQASSARFVTNQ